MAKNTLSGVGYAQTQLLGDCPNPGVPNVNSTITKDHCSYILLVCNRVLNNAEVSLRAS